MENGTVVHLDYELYNAETDELLETTLKEVAEEADRLEPNREYSPLVTIVGGSRLIEGFEEHLETAEAETDYEFEIPAEKGYGERDPEMVETVALDKLLSSVKDHESLAIGGPVEYGGRTGKLALVAAGRARIDFNHPLAGTKLRYKYRIVKVVEDRSEKIESLLNSTYGQGGFEVTLDEDHLTVRLPESAMYDPQWAMAKFQLVRTLRDHTDVGTIIFQEVHEQRAPVMDEEE